MLKKISYLILFYLLFCISACGSIVNSSLMSPVHPNQTEEIDKNTARITFYRPSAGGYLIQAPIAESINNEMKLCGIASYNSKFRYMVSPGQHFFVVGGESSSILKADVVAGKNYYVKIIPKFGIMKARFCFEPLSKGQLEDSKYQNEIKKCQLVAPNDSSKSWFAENYSSMKEKFDNAINDFNKLQENRKSKFILNKDDCIDKLY